MEPQDNRTTGPQDNRTTGPQDNGATGPQDSGTRGPRDEGGAFEKAEAFGKAIASGMNKAEDIYLWEHGVAVEPWPEPVDGKALLDEVESRLKRFVVVAKWVSETLALWVVHTYAFQLRQVATIPHLQQQVTELAHLLKPRLHPSA